MKGGLRYIDEQPGEVDAVYSKSLLCSWERIIRVL